MNEQDYIMKHIITTKAQAIAYVLLSWALFIVLLIALYELEIRL